MLLPIRHPFQKCLAPDPGYKKTILCLHYFLFFWKRLDLLTSDVSCWNRAPITRSDIYVNSFVVHLFWFKNLFITWTVVCKKPFEKWLSCSKDTTFCAKRNEMRNGCNLTLRVFWRQQFKQGRYIWAGVICLNRFVVHLLLVQKFSHDLYYSL